MPAIRITAPEKLSEGLNQFLAEANLKDLTSVEVLKQTIIDFSKAINNGFGDNPEFLSPEGEEARDAFFEKYVNWSNDVLVAALKEKGITGPIETTLTGIQGAGKGTYNDTFQQLAQEMPDHMDPNDPVVRMLKAKARTLEVKVGTGGIFAHEPDLSKIGSDDIAQLEYHELFNSMKNAMGAAKGVFIENNVVCIAVNLYMALKVLQSKDGISSFNLDIYPRSIRQAELFKKTKQKLEESGIEVNHNLIDFKLLSEDDVQYLMDHKQQALEIIPTVNQMFSPVFELAKSQKEIYDFDDLEHDISIVFNSSKDNQDVETIRIIELMQKECAEAIQRAKLRAREDDNPLALLKRLNDYFKNSFTLPLTYDNPLVIATKGKPKDIAKGFFCKYFNIGIDDPSIEKGGKYYEIFRKYQYLTTVKVCGKFEKETGTENLKRIVRERDGVIEYINVTEDGNIHYSVVLKDGMNLTFLISEKGTTIVQESLKTDEDEIISTGEIIKEKMNLELEKGDTIEMFIEKNPELWEFASELNRK